jgi:hypothetical protein
MPSPYRSIFRSLAERNLLVPYLQNAVLAGEWPDSYQVTVDSRPWYGHGDGYFHPSSHAMLGARQLYYMFHPDHRDRLVPEQRDVPLEMSAAVGSSLHAVVQAQFQHLGLLRPENVEKGFIIEDHHVRGRTDMIVDHPAEGPVVTEIKTRTPRGFDYGKLTESWETQLSIALYALGHAQGVLLEIEAGYPWRMREYRVNRNDEMLSAAFAKFDYVRECIAMNTPPPHCCAIGSSEMDKCPAKYECWLKSKVIRE